MLLNFGSILPKLVLGTKTWAAAVGYLRTTFLRLLLPITLLVGALEEISEFFSPTGKKTLLGTNINTIGDSIVSFWDKIKDVGIFEALDWAAKLSNQNDPVMQILQSRVPTEQERLIRRQSLAPRMQGNTVVKLEVEGNQLAEAVVKTPTFKDGVDGVIEQSITEGR